MLNARMTRLQFIGLESLSLVSNIILNLPCSGLYIYVIEYTQYIYTAYISLVF
jgi:hypothetical protein